MTFNGELDEKDALRLLATLRYIRGNLSDEDAHVIAAEAKIGDVTVPLTVGHLIDIVLAPYKDYDTSELT